MASATNGLTPGTLLDGKYEIVGLLGAGGMGEVYKALHVHLGAFRCIKVIKAALIAEEGYRVRFLREARLATQVHHPNVAVVHDFSVMPDGTSYMVTEFIDGTTVREWEAENGRFPLPLAIEVGTQVLAGLDAIHRRGLMHRDVSADNVMLAFDADEHLIVKIIDLGVAKDVSGPNVDTTQAGVFIGNPKYMSPEHLGELEEGEALDGRADLYSLGVVLFEMLTGVPPFVARTPNMYIVKHLTEAPRTFKDANPILDAPAGLEAVVMRALEKRRAQRWSSARDFADALAPYASRDRVEFTKTAVPRMRAAEISPEERRAAEAWAAAQAADTYSVFRDYRAKFPMYHAEEAERAIEERLDYDAASALDTEEAWGSYLERWSHDAHAKTAAERLEAARVREETAYSVALEMKSAIAWQAYLDEFPDSARGAQAEIYCREQFAYEEARRADTVAAWGLFLLNHPDGLRDHDAHERLQWLESAEERRALARRAIVEGDFNAAFEKGTVAAWDEYLVTYPDAPRAEEARRARQEATEYELAESVNTKVMWRAFVKAWPEGRHRLDAELRLRK
ncbi:MAG TPA: serine/threonine-protein kinase [Thermoanaerobaculia bacterium]|jgi:serine/threonine-protein kinase|nr:serine/threonine-protein kinase [Thermoanaerobaculia bacterium]